jgi:hypothetical protein
MHERQIVTLDSIDLTLWLAGIAMETILLALIVWRRIYRALPVFFLYIFWCLLNDAGSMACAHYLSAEGYLRVYLLVGMIPATLLELGVLVEVGRSVMRYNGAVRPGLVLIVLLALLACVLVFPLNRWRAPTQLPIFQLIYLVSEQLCSILQVAFLLTLVWWSSLKGFRWPACELRIVTGLGFCAIVSLASVIIHSHNLVGMQYHWLDQIVVASYLGALTYWVWSSATKALEQQ